jgi:hypothetical protein
MPFDPNSAKKAVKNLKGTCKKRGAFHQKKDGNAL